MTKSEIFSLAHHKTRIEQLKAIALGRKFSYHVTFSFYLKELTNAEPQKVTIYGYKPVDKAVKKKVNKSCAMVGDYKKPSIANDSLELPFFILSVFAILIIFALTLQAINYL